MTCDIDLYLSLCMFGSLHNDNTFNTNVEVHVYHAYMNSLTFLGGSHFQRHLIALIMVFRHQYKFVCHSVIWQTMLNKELCI